MGRRVTFAQFNALVNAYPGADGVGRLDGYDFYFDSDNLIVGDARGVVALEYVGHGVYVWHWVCSPAMRGKEALQLGRQAIRSAFTRQKVKVIRGSTPATNLAARRMNRALGASAVGESIDFAGRRCIDYVLTRGSADGIGEGQDIKTKS